MAHLLLAVNEKKSRLFGIIIKTYKDAHHKWDNLYVAVVVAVISKC